MKKYLFFLILFSNFSLAQQIDSVTFPNKNYFIGFLNPKPKAFLLDTSIRDISTLQYHSFSTKGQMIKVNHTQSFTDYLDIKMDLTKFSQEGIFNRENLKLYDVNTFFLFSNKKKNYTAQSLLSYQKIRTDENGGLSENISTDIDDPILYDVHLSSAQNTSKNRYHLFKHQFKLNEQLSLLNQISVLKRTKTYTDNLPNSGYYSTIFLDSTLTNDSIKNTHFNTQLGVKYKNLSFIHLLNRRSVSFYTTDSNIIDNGLGVCFDQYSQQLSVNLSIFQSGHYSFALEKVLDKNYQHTIFLEAQRHRVPIFYNHYISNHYRSQNDFMLESTQSLSYFLKTPHIELKSNIFHRLNHIYFNEFSQVVQDSSSIFHTKNQLSFYWNFFRFKGVNSIEHQWTNNTQLIRVPIFNMSASIWYENLFFESLLRLKMGLKVNYFTSFYAKAYNPSLGLFYLQNNVEVGNVPLVDFFINFQISNMTINFQFQNLGFQFANQVHYFIPNYVSQVGRIKLSLVWRLFND